MSKPIATGGNEPKSAGSVKQMFDRYRAAVKARPRPTRRPWSYTMAKDGTVTMTMESLLVAINGKAEAERFEEDLAMWYDQQGVSREPWLKGETLAAYKARTTKRLQGVEDEGQNRSRP